MPFTPLTYPNPASLYGLPYTRHLHRDDGLQIVTQLWLSSEDEHVLQELARCVFSLLFSLFSSLFSLLSSLFFSLLSSLFSLFSLLSSLFSLLSSLFSFFRFSVLIALSLIISFEKGCLQAFSVLEVRKVGYG